MASLAGMLQARGHRVTGSDRNVYPPMSTMLAELGIELMQDYLPAHLEPAPDCVVVGNALSRGNAEVEETLRRRLLYRSQAEVVKEEFIRSSVDYRAGFEKKRGKWIMTFFLAGD